MKKLCIFDLDGTLAETKESIAYFLNKTMRHFSLGTIDAETACSFVGNGAKKLIERALSFNGSDIPVNEALSVYMNYYDSEPTYLVRIYDGIYELISSLKARGVDVAVLSNKPDSSTKLIVNHFFAEDTFFKCLGKCDNFKTKPDPEAADYIACGYNKKNCFFIGDSEVDVVTGKNAKMNTVSVTWGFRKKEVLLAQNPDYIADTPEEILSFVMGNNR